MIVICKRLPFYIIAMLGMLLLIDYFVVRIVNQYFRVKGEARLMIKLSKVYKSFDKRVVLALDVSLTVSKNEFVCITGESGAGKTTLLNLIGLLDKPDSGEVSINDKIHFTSKEILKLRRNFFGYVFQDYLLMNDKTVQENINISKDIFKYENRKQKKKI